MSSSSSSTTWVDGLRLLRQRPVRDAPDRPPGARRHAIHGGLLRLHGLLAHPRQPADRQVPGPAPHHRLDPRPDARQSEDARPRLDQVSPARGGDARRRLPRGRLCHREHRQVAPRRPGVLPGEARLRPERRGDPPAPTAHRVLRAVEDPDPGRGYARRLPDRSPRPGGRAIHRRFQGPAVLPLPPALRSPHPDPGSGGPGQEVPGEAAGRADSYERRLRGDDRERRCDGGPGPRRPRRARAGRPDRHRRDVGQRRAHPDDVEPPPACRQGLLLRGRDARPPDRLLAGGDEAGEHSATCP